MPFGGNHFSISGTKLPLLTQPLAARLIKANKLCWSSAKNSFKESFTKDIVKMSAPLTFGDFYAPIRSHFSSNVWDYEKFKRCKDNRAKVEYLIGHAVVQTALNGLASRNILTPLCSFFGPPEIKEKCQGVDWKARIIQSQGKYPQLSSKVEVKASKKKGRMLVAKEKIEAGDKFIIHCLLTFNPLFSIRPSANPRKSLLYIVIQG